MDLGVRDETPSTSGALQAWKNTYLKTIKHTNETVNYNMVLMSGGYMEMTYDQERTYFRGNCLPYDTIDMFQMMVDIALEPKTMLSANVAKMKNRQSQNLQKHLLKYDPFKDANSLLLKTAFG